MPSTVCGGFTQPCHDHSQFWKQEEEARELTQCGGLGEAL